MTENIKVQKYTQRKAKKVQGGSNMTGTICV
jgi:hypothetical protein